MNLRTRWQAWRQPLLHWLKVAALISLLLAVAIFGIGASYAARHSKDDIKLGISFSSKYANELGVDYQDALSTILNDLDVSSVRLMSYWDLHEPTNNTYDFRSLDAQMAIARRYNVPVTLAIGQRQPRWPECHIPTWAKQLNQDIYRQELLSYIQTVVNRYKDDGILASYQLENEAANNLFGHCPKFENTFMQTEFDLVKSLDSQHLLITNVSNQSGVPMQEPTGDKIGFSIYKQAYFPALGQDVQWNFWYVPSWWHGFRAALNEAINDQAPSFVHELQAEPWGPVDTEYLSDQTQKELMNSALIRRNVDFALQSGMKEVYLWGGEWWYWRLTQFNDRQLWNDMQELYAHSQDL